MEEKTTYSESHEYLVLKYIEGRASKDETSYIETWMKEDPANEKELLELSRIHHAQMTLLRIRKRNSHEAYAKVQGRIRRKSVKQIFSRISVAASLIIGLLGIGSFIAQHMKPEDVSMITVYSNAGMRSQVELPDGTIVHLNANSTLKYPARYARNERKVQLSGEAYFTVSHDTKRPFVVNTPNNKLDIEVLGTEFNLQAYDNDSLFLVTLIDGSVQLNKIGKEEHVKLSPSERATYMVSTDNIQVETVNIDMETAWVEGKLIFRDTPMQEVLRQLSHFYSVKFDIMDPVIKDYVFTGTFDNKPLFQVLDYMKISSKMSYVMTYLEIKDLRDPVIKMYNN